MACLDVHLQSRFESGTPTLDGSYFLSLAGKGDEYRPTLVQRHASVENGADSLIVNGSKPPVQGVEQVRFLQRIEITYMTEKEKNIQLKKIRAKIANLTEAYEKSVGSLEDQLYTLEAVVTEEEKVRIELAGVAEAYYDEVKWRKHVEENQIHNLC